jgi:hypothetical protein
VESNQNKKPSVGSGYEIDQRAIKVFRNWLPDSWLPREQLPDFFVDFLVETVEAGEPTGLHFGAQVKGKAKAKNLSYAFKAKHLRYYVNRCQHPIFLFLIDVAAGEGWWLFAQKLIREGLSKDSLGRQKQITLKFRAEDNFSDFQRFRGALVDAERYVRDLHPGSVAAALQKRKQELEAKDPRVFVSIAAQADQQHITLHPKESFTFTTKISSRNPALRDAWRNFVERGSELKLKSGEFEIVGAPLLEDLTKSRTGELTVQCASPLPASVQIVFGDMPQPTVIQIEGQLKGGTKFAVFDGKLAETPLAMNVELAFEPHRESAQKSSLEFSLRNWAGQPLLFLSHFEQVDSLVHALGESEAPSAQLLVRGNRLWTGRLSGFDAGDLKNIVGTMAWLRQCRYLAERFRINPPLPILDKLSDAQWDSVEDAHRLIVTKEVITPAPGLTISCAVSSAPPASVLGGGDGVLRLEKPEETFDILGHQICIGPVRYLFTEMSIASRSSPEGGRTEFVFKGSPNTTRTLELLDA